ncbi:MAG: hypothetical protein D3916_01685 [Candidatus Electrothrix sp. MAN1_4]|nr:hypothetical protein [Candidatus Electrothrix sp. MAN1_4]
MLICKNNINNIITIILPKLTLLTRFISYIHKKISPYHPKKRILLISRNTIAADHMLPIANLLRNMADISLTSTVDRFPNQEFHNKDATNLLGTKSIHILIAIIQHWDLIIFTNHPYGFGLCFSPKIKKLYINHGLHMGKINTIEFQDGVYGKNKILRPLGSPYYSTMFAASNNEYQFAVDQTPELMGRIEVAGYLKADILLENYDKLRTDYRFKINCERKELVLHIISTWGPNSLLSTYWPQIQNELESLKHKYKIIISIHPRFNQLTPKKKHTREEILRECQKHEIYINDGLDWEGYVAASDITLTDHSSLCLYHVLLNHPILLIPVEADQYLPESTFSHLNKAVLSIADYPTILQGLDVAEKQINFINYEFLAAKILSKRGMASKVYLEKITRILDVN